MGRKQSLADRLRRFNEGCCSIHGLFMGQIDGWYYPEDRDPYTVVGCPRRNCNAEAMANSYDGPWELMPKCAYLLDEALPPSVLKVQNRSGKALRSSKAKKSGIWAKTEGQCYCCGLQLDWNTTFSIDHVVPRIEGGLDSIENIVPSCRSCNSTKGVKSVEEFRFFRSMQKFEKRNGVKFSIAQVEYLGSIGVEIDVPSHAFWFEQR